MINPATGWLEIKEPTNKETITTTNMFKQTWLTQYPIPQILSYDRGTEFITEFAEMMEICYQKKMET
jgi:hypothetical protein